MLLKKPDLYKMIVEKCNTNKAAIILRLIHEKTGSTISRDFLVTMPTSKKRLFIVNAEIIADFLDINIEKIECFGIHNKEREKIKNHTWEFSLAAQRINDLMPLFNHSLNNPVHNIDSSGIKCIRSVDRR